MFKRLPITQRKTGPEFNLSRGFAIYNPSTNDWNRRVFWKAPITGFVELGGLDINKYIHANDDEPAVHEKADIKTYSILSFWQLTWEAREK